MTSCLRQRTFCYLLILMVAALWSGCAGGSDSDADASDAGTDGATDGADVGDGSLPTEYYRAVAISEAFDPLKFDVQNQVDVAGRLLGTYLGNIHFSDDDGETWTLLPAPFKFPSEKVHRTLVLNETTGSVFAFSTSFRLYRSDGGATFEELTSPFALNGSGVARELVVGDDGAIWALAHRFQYAIEDYGLAVSTDNGETFDARDLPFELAEEDAIAASQGLIFFAGPSGTVFLSVNRERLYRRTLDSDWELIDGVSFVLQHFVTESGVVLITFRDINTYKFALSTDGGQTFTIAQVSEAGLHNDTFAQLEDGTILRVNLDGQLRVLSEDGSAWDEAVAAYPADQESPYLANLPKVDRNSLELEFEWEILRWTKGDDEWTSVTPPPVIPLASKILDITVTASGKAAVLVSKNNRGVIYVSDDGGDTWRLGQRFDEGVLTLAMKPEGDLIFVGGAAGRSWLLDGDGLLPAGVESSVARKADGAFPVLQSVWTPNFGRNSYLLTVGANPEDSDGYLSRATFYTERGEFIDTKEIDPLRDPLYPTRDNPAGMRSIQYSGPSIAVGLRQYGGGLARQDRLMIATTLQDWSDSPTEFYDQPRPVAFGTPLSMTSRTSDDCKMFGQLYSEGRLYDGAFPVEITEGFPIAGTKINDIECGPGGVWWIGTSLGLYELERLP